MKIDNLDKKTYFGNITKTEELFETVLLKNFKNSNIEGIRTVTKDLYPEMKHVGHLGYRHYAIKIRDAVFKKYPSIKEDATEILQYISANPKISKLELASFVKPYIQKYGETIDINI